MQKLQSQQIAKLRQVLRKHLRGKVADIFIIGSLVKDKPLPRDIDIIVLFKEKNLKQAGSMLFEIKEDLDFVKNLHIEPIFEESMLEESIFLTVMHEGFSIKYGKPICEMLKLKSYVIFAYNLKNLSQIDKIRFAQALYGRKRDGLLFQEKGISLGPGSFMVDVREEELFKEFFSKWKVKFLKKRAFVSD